MIVVCGEALIDLVPCGDDVWRALPGGSPANTAVALARLGVPTTILARLSRDPFGVRLREWLAANDVDLRFAITAEAPTTLAVVAFDDGGGAHYTFHLDGSADWQWSDAEMPATLPADAHAIHAGSMALLRQPGGPVLEAFLAREHANRIISIDPNVRPPICPNPDEYRAHVERWLPLAHIVKASTDDVRWLYPDRQPFDVLADWVSRGVLLAVLTRGADGAVARTSSGDEVVVPGVALNVVDTIGAGDTFSAALLYALEAASILDTASLANASRPQIADTLAFGVRASALVCTRPGADPPTLAELQR